MSRVRISEELIVFCLNSSSAQSSACDRSAQGISLSTPILMTTFGVVGNVLALIVLYSSRREAHARRTVFFVMLAGLAWTDLIGQFAVSPIAILTYANNLRWMGGAELCRYHGFMMVSFGLVMPLIVCCMSVERLLAIKFSYYYAKHITRRKAKLTFLTCWGITAVFTFLPFVGLGSYELQFPGTWCFLNFHRQSEMDSIYAAIFSIFNILAIAVMIMCNLTVAASLFSMRRSRQMDRSQSGDRRVSASVMGSTTTQGVGVRPRRRSDMEAQMIWFLCLITVAFSVCWLPLNVHILLMQFTGHTNRTLDLKVIRMASCNQILDPWLYVIFRKNSLIRILRRLRACITLLQLRTKHRPAPDEPVRYVISNRSYTYQANSFARNTAAGEQFCYRGTSPSVCQCHYALNQSTISDQPKNRLRTDCSPGSSDSGTQHVSSCSYCNNHRQSLHSPTLKPSDESSSPTTTDTKSFFQRDVSAKDNNKSNKTNRRGLSEPFLPIKIKRALPTSAKTVESLDSSQISCGYYSLDSVHHSTPKSAIRQTSIPNDNVSHHQNQNHTLGNTNSIELPDHPNPFFSEKSSPSNKFYDCLALPRPAFYSSDTLGLMSYSHDKEIFNEYNQGTKSNNWITELGSSSRNLPLFLENIPELSDLYGMGNVLFCNRSPLSTTAGKRQSCFVNRLWIKRTSSAYFPNKALLLDPAIQPFKAASSGTKSTSANSSSQCVDHSEHIKCFKSRKSWQCPRESRSCVSIGHQRKPCVSNHNLLGLSTGSCP